MKSSLTRRRQIGATAVELLVGLPVVLLLSLGLFQLSRLYQVRLGIEQAVIEAARSGSTGNAGDAAIQRGLARGLAPLLHGAGDATELQANEARALAQVTAGLADGSLSLTRESPTAAAFEDWEVPAIDAFGEPIPGQFEIPNDNLDTRRTRSTPRSGIAGYREDEPIGSVSGLTLVDANVLRVGLTYGAPLSVPLAGRLIAAVLRAWHGCDGSQAAAPATGPATGLCGHLLATPPRLPMRATATLRMMSPARRSGGGQAVSGAVGYPPAAGTGAADARRGIAAKPGEPEAPADGAVSPGHTDRMTTEGGSGGASGSVPGAGPDASTAGAMANGFLLIGSDRVYPTPSFRHPALCDG